MKKNVIGYCPICNERLLVKTLHCEHCDTELTGEFVMSPFDYLSKEQLQFALIFIKNQGNIKQIEKELNISYPTVKKNIDDLIDALGFNKVVKADIKPSKQTVLRKLRNKEISFEEAERLMGETI
ncbi:MAG: DUF2089 domain-containing protein [Acholeplasmatales bacterium]|nr:DUF2089 domain-containing protein [Acholeplasmatales bacterium]